MDQAGGLLADLMRRKWRSTASGALEVHWLELQCDRVKITSEWHQNHSRRIDDQAGSEWTSEEGLPKFFEAGELARRIAYLADRRANFCRVSFVFSAGATASGLVHRVITDEELEISCLAAGDYELRLLKNGRVMERYREWKRREKALAETGQADQERI